MTENSEVAVNVIAERVIMRTAVADGTVTLIEMDLTEAQRVHANLSHCIEALVAERTIQTTWTSFLDTVTIPKSAQP